MNFHAADPVPSSEPLVPYGRIAILGAGAWGTALAVVAARARREVRLWARRAEHAAAINADGENVANLPGCPLPEGITATGDIAEALEGAEAVLLVTPSTTVREMCRRAAPYLAPGVPVILCAKGIERGTGLLLSEVASEELPEAPIGALSGPTFADETAKNFPTAATVAFAFGYRDRLEPMGAPAARLAVSMGSAAFRPYISDDLLGVEVGGAVKNVIAIACGMMSGAGFAANTRAALITKGLAEMSDLAAALGGRRETLMGLSGAGDLTLTCSSTQSRNMSLGTQLGQGIPRAECFGGRAVTVEGEYNALSVTDLARRTGTAMPVCEAVRQILHEGAPIGDTFASLWSRPIEAEGSRLTIELDHPARAADIEKLAERMP
ncbi:MAG: NAD(P)H-dependent glycerol-3-phosphate dehydrogenase [Pseudomonadota bacterium]